MVLGKMDHLTLRFKWCTGEPGNIHDDTKSQRVDEGYLDCRGS